MPLADLAQMIREETKKKPLTVRYKDLGNGEWDSYPYLRLPLESGNGIADIAGVSQGIMAEKLFGPITADASLHPESKQFALSVPFTRTTGIPGIFTRKRPYGNRGEIVIAVETPYGETSRMFCPEFMAGSERLIFCDDMISGSGTSAGHIMAFEEQVPEKYGHPCEVLGAVTVYERGDGIEKLRGRFPGKEFEALLRLDVVPDPGISWGKEVFYQGQTQEELVRDIIYHTTMSDLGRKYGRHTPGELISMLFNLPKEERMLSYEALDSVNHYLKPEIRINRRLL